MMAVKIGSVILQTVLGHLFSDNAIVVSFFVTTVESSLADCCVLLFRDIDAMETSDVCEEVPQKLWVDRYAPRTYTDLLSEEVNIIFSLAFIAFATCKCNQIPAVSSD